MILHAFRRAGLRPGRDAAIAIDVASTHFFQGGLYRLKDALLSAASMSAHAERLGDRYPILSIEDGMAEDDWAGWKTLTDALGQRVQLIGDDLFVTNPRPTRAGHRARRRQQHPDQGQPDRHADRNACRDRASPRTPAIAASSRPAAAKPRTAPSPTSRSPPASAKSRSAPSPAANGSPSTTSFCASRNRWERVRRLPIGKWEKCD